MLVYAGIDEAGYGPMLGPLCVACSVLTIEDHDPETGPCDLWKRLAKAVCRKRTDSRKRIAIDDSKKLKGARDGSVHPLRFLERGVLSFLHAIDSNLDHCSCDHEYLSRVGAHGGERPWYGSQTHLPVGLTGDELRIAAGRLRQTLSDQKIRCVSLRCETIDAGEFNQQVDRMGTKSNVNFCAALRHIDAIWKRWPTEHPRVMVDRQGGRTHYLNDLMLAWPDAEAQVLCETPLLSRYRLRRGDSWLTVSFQVEAEQAHLPVALASMTAKYTRELLMIRLNRFFHALMPELKPTAGYVEDGRRYVADIEPLIAQLGLSRTDLIRSV